MVLRELATDKEEELLEELLPESVDGADSGCCFLVRLLHRQPEWFAERVAATDWERFGGDRSFIFLFFLFDQQNQCVLLCLIMPAFPLTPFSASR